MTEHVDVVQVVRHIGPGTGVGGVAHALDWELTGLGYRVATVTAESIGIDSWLKPFRRQAQLHLFLEIVLFSVTAPFVVRSRYPGSVSISHNDCLTGDIYVNHGVHHALVRRPGGRHLLLHPLHAFLFVREAIRFRARLPRTVVNFSAAGEQELAQYFDLTSLLLARIPNGVDLTTFDFSPSGRDRVRTELGLTSDDAVVLFVGNEFRRKGLHHLQRAMEHLPESTHLVVVGGTEQMVESARRDSAPRIARRVHFVGRVTVGLSDWYSAADVYALPSEQEAWPLSILEALACGTPCVATRTSSVPEILDPVTGDLLADTDPATIAQALTQRLATSPRSDGQLRGAIRDRVLHFGWGRVASMYRQVIEEMRGDRDAGG